VPRPRLFLFLVLFATRSVAHPIHLPATALEADAAVLYDALRALHPGIYRYSSADEFNARYAALRHQFRHGASLERAFLSFARFAAAIRCGHTWTNPLNQPPEVAAALLDRADRLPLHFTVVGRRFLVTAATDGSQVHRFDEIVTIDGIGVEAVTTRLWPYLRADGASDGKRLAQIGHDAGQSAFDIYYSPIAPPIRGTRVLGLRPPGAKGIRLESVALLTETAREDSLRRQGAAQSEDWSYRIDGVSAVVTMPTWAFWNRHFDWRSWLDRCFTDLRAHAVTALIIDLRRNEGGDGAIGDEMLRRLSASAHSYASHYPRLIYDIVPDRLRAYLSTWDRSFYDQRPRIEPLGAADYTLIDREPETVEIRPAREPFTGRVIVLVGPTDSSATFEFARIVKETGLAILVGQATGGNLRGINGGDMFFLKLPHTGISIDVPVIGWMARTPQPDAPVAPDALVTPDLDATARGEDPDLAEARRLISLSK